MEKYNYTEYHVEGVGNKRVVIITDVHNCHVDWHDMPTYERMELLCSALTKEYENNPYDCLLALGDYSLDHWRWDIGGSYLWEKPVSKTQDFMNRFYSKLPLRLYMLPGNHEQYGEEDWKRITGFEREYAVVCGEYVFVMLDTFAGELDPKENSDGVYSGINADLVKAVLKNHPEKKLILCAHDLIIGEESKEARELIFKEKQILCAMTGHTHRDNTVILPDAWRNMPVFYCGDFSYNGGRQKEKNWGYRTIEFTDGGFSTEYVRVSAE